MSARCRSCLASPRWFVSNFLSYAMLYVLSYISVFFFFLPTQLRYDLTTEYLVTNKVLTVRSYNPVGSGIYLTTNILESNHSLLKGGGLFPKCHGFLTKPPALLTSHLDSVIAFGLNEHYQRLKNKIKRGIPGSCTVGAQPLPWNSATVV